MPRFTGGYGFGKTASPNIDVLKKKKVCVGRRGWTAFISQKCKHPSSARDVLRLAEVTVRYGLLITQSGNLCSVPSVRDWRSGVGAGRPEPYGASFWTVCCPWK